MSDDKEIYLSNHCWNYLVTSIWLLTFGEAKLPTIPIQHSVKLLIDVLTITLYKINVNINNIINIISPARVVKTQNTR